MAVTRWEDEARRLAALARLDLAPEELARLASACQAITADFAALAEHARGLPEPDLPAAGALRQDAVDAAPASEVEGILRAAPRVDAAGRTVLVPRGIP